MGTKPMNLSPQISWNGDGLPPIGCECDASVDGGSTWKSWYTVAEDSGVVIFGYLDGHHVAFGKKDMPIFRPVRTETERRREHQVEAISQILTYRNGCSPKPMAGWIVDAIAAGKVPGVRLTDDTGS